MNQKSSWCLMLGCEILIGCVSGCVPDLAKRSVAS